MSLPSFSPLSTMQPLSRRLLSALVLLLLCAQSRALNELVNGGFETGDLTGWVSTYAASGSCDELYSGDCHTGDYCFLFCDYQAGEYDQLEQAVAVTPNRVFQLSLWLWSWGPSWTLQVQQDGVQLFSESDVVADYHYWNEYCVQFTSDGTGGTVLGFLGNSGESFMMDDIAILELPVGTVASTGVVPCYAPSSSSSSSGLPSSSSSFASSSSSSLSSSASSSLSSASSSSSSSSSSTTLNEIVNGGFEDGLSSWTVTAAAQGTCEELYIAP